MSGGIELEGAQALETGLASFADHLENWDALRGVAEDWRDRAQRRAPKMTGRLASSLQVRSASGDWQVASSLPYARVIHNGWAAHSIRANPFLADTIDADQAGERLAADMASELAGIRGA